jgi:hypothetical protein
LITPQRRLLYPRSAKQTPPCTHFSYSRTTPPTRIRSGKRHENLSQFGLWITWEIQKTARNGMSACN